MNNLFSRVIAVLLVAGQLGQSAMATGPWPLDTPARSFLFRGFAQQAVVPALDGGFTGDRNLDPTHGEIPMIKDAASSALDEHPSTLSRAIPFVQRFAPLFRLGAAVVVLDNLFRGIAFSLVGAGGDFHRGIDSLTKAPLFGPFYWINSLTYSTSTTGEMFKNHIETLGMLAIFVIPTVLYVLRAGVHTSLSLWALRSRRISLIRLTQRADVRLISEMKAMSALMGITVFSTLIGVLVETHLALGVDYWMYRGEGYAVVFNLNDMLFFVTGAGAFFWGLFDLGRHIFRFTRANRRPVRRSSQLDSRALQAA